MIRSPKSQNTWIQRSYSSDEYEFINQIYEPVVQYHYYAGRTASCR
jgi:hypothetical protein